MMGASRRARAACAERVDEAKGASIHAFSVLNEDQAATNFFRVSGAPRRTP